MTASSPQSLRDLLSTVGPLVIADYFSSWCTACRSLFPKLRQLAENNPDVLFVKVCWSLLVLKTCAFGAHKLRPLA